MSSLPAQRIHPHKGAQPAAHMCADQLPHAATQKATAPSAKRTPQTACSHLSCHSHNQPALSNALPIQDNSPNTAWYKSSRATLMACRSVARNRPALPQITHVCATDTTLRKQRGQQLSGPACVSAELHTTMQHACLSTAPESLNGTRWEATGRSSQLC